MKIKRNKIKSVNEIGSNKKTTYFDLTRVIIVFLCCVGSIYPSIAQCQLSSSSIKPNEEIDYVLYFYWGILWKEAGVATYTSESIDYRGNPALRLQLTMQTNETADNFFKMRDTITSIISDKLEPLYYRKAAEEGKRFTIDESYYTYEGNKSIATLKRTWKDGEVKNYDNIESYECIYDMLSVLGKARSMNPNEYKKGDRFKILMTTGKKAEELILEYRGIESVKSENKKNYKCMVYTLLKEGKKNKLKDFITFYISNDDLKLLVKLKFELNFGSAQVNLKEVKKI